jgi:hypothetical protein
MTEGEAGARPSRAGARLAKADAASVPANARGGDGVDRDVDRAERTMGRFIARALPIVCLAAAIAAGAIGSVASSVLILAAGALLGTIALLWASLRTLTGDAPLPTDLEVLAVRPVDELGERKRRVLRALRDLESEHALGKIGDVDYADLREKYRDEAKDVLRQLDERVAPSRAEAERIAREYLARNGIGPTDVSSTAPRGPTPARVACPRCQESNEADAAFCKRCGEAMKSRSERDDAKK